MSQQINLYDPALMRQRELLTAANLAAVALALSFAVGGWGAWVRKDLATVEQEDRAVTSRLKTVEEQMTSMAKAAASTRPDARLEGELAAARGLLQLHAEVLAALKKAIGNESIGFAEYMRGLARQTPHGIWLTGFTIDGGGAAIEIRGRMTDASLLSEYVRRLNTEEAFRGRAFAALRIAAPQAAPKSGPQEPAGTERATPPHLEFTLVPVQAGPREANAAAAEPRR